MAKRKCPACAELILGEAVKCKHCGVTVTPIKGGSVGRVLFVVIGTIAMCGWVAAKLSDGTGESTPSHVSQSAASTPQAPREAPRLIAAAALAAAYDKNEVAADNEYKGKVLRVAGKIRSIGKDITDDPYLTMGSSFKGVNCYFDSKHAGTIAAINKGDAMVLEGKCSGLTIGSVILRDCRIPSDDELRADHPEVAKATPEPKKKRPRRAAVEDE